jgi:hypothetical protein
LVVAMSRARLGLYVFCRRALFASCFELAPTFAQLAEAPEQLELVRVRVCADVRDRSLTQVAGEAYGTVTRSPDKRLVRGKEAIPVDDVVHLAKLVG